MDLRGRLKNTCCIVVIQNRFECTSLQQSSSLPCPGPPGLTDQGGEWSLSPLLTASNKPLHTTSACPYGNGRLVGALLQLLLMASGPWIPPVCCSMAPGRSIAVNCKLPSTLESTHEWICLTLSNSIKSILVLRGPEDTHPSRGSWRSWDPPSNLRGTLGLSSCSTLSAWVHLTTLVSR